MDINDQRRMDREHWCWYRVVVMLMVFIAIASAPLKVAAQSDPSERDRFVEAVSACFNKLMRARSDGYSPSLYTDVFVGQRASEYMLAQDADLSSEAAGEFCRRTLVPEYVQLRGKAELNRRKILHARPTLARLSEPIELDGTFIDGANNLVLDHTITGHTDLTWRALDNLRDEIKLSDFARQLIVDASQMPDLYQWENELYHAHTCKMPDLAAFTCHSDRGEMADWDRAVADSKSMFIELVSDMVLVSRRKLARLNLGAAFFWLGSGCHVVQDLAYHRGMTLIQHSGLSHLPGYGGDLDPDKPRGELRAEKERQGAENCGRLIRAVLGELADTRKQRVESWEPGVNEDAYSLAEREFGKKPDMTGVSLAAYVALSLKYAELGRSTSELDVLKDGTATWDVDDVMSAIFGRIDQQP